LWKKKRSSSLSTAMPLELTTMLKVRTTLAIALVIAPLAVLATACSRPPEQQHLTQFFRAARARDNATLAMMSAVSFDPRTQGTVEDFEITSVTPERRTALDFKSLLEAERQARQAEAEFSKKKKEYQDANLPIIEQVIKLERDPAAKWTPAQAKVKAEWDKWRADTGTFAKATSAARAAIASGTGPAEASLTQPGQAAFTPDQFQGEMISKDVTLNAQVRSPEGQTAQKTLTITMQRAMGTFGGQQREGRWIITAIQGA
jgi:hypothetical protein